MDVEGNKSEQAAKVGKGMNEVYVKMEYFKNLAEYNRIKNDYQKALKITPFSSGFQEHRYKDITYQKVDTVVGIAINGIPYASFIADKLGLEMAVFRPHHEKSGTFSSNYASVKGKNVVFIDDVVCSL